MSYRFLEAKQRYVVVQDFIDFDRILHSIGESWTFLRSSFVPYEDGLSLFVSFDGKVESQIRLQWRDEEQGPLIDQFSNYVRLSSGR